MSRSYSVGDQHMRKFAGSFRPAQMARNFFCSVPRVLPQAVMHAVGPSIAYMMMLESFKLTAISMASSDNLDDDAKERVTSAYKNMGCKKNTIRFCNVGFAFPVTLTSILVPNLVLFSCQQPYTQKEYQELYAIAGHEAVHSKEHHGALEELSFFMTYEIARELGKSFMPGRPFLVASVSFLCAMTAYRQVLQACEYRADAVSAEKLQTGGLLKSIFESGMGQDESPMFHPDFHDRSVAMCKY